MATKHTKCKTCKNNIGANDRTYNCVACQTVLHLTTECTGLSPVAVNGIKELGSLAMLICSTCNERNARDKFIRCYTNSKLNEKLENLDINEKLLSMENKLCGIIDKKIDDVDKKLDEAFKYKCEKVEKTYSSALSDGLKKAATPMNVPSLSKTPHNISQSVRIQGIPEDPSKSKAENLVPTNEAVLDIMRKLNLDTRVMEMKRLGKFDENRIKPRTLLVTLSSEHEVRLVLAKYRERGKEFSNDNIFILPALSKEEATLENLILKRRRELINEGVPTEKLKIRNLKLYNDKVEVVVSQETE